MSAPSFYFNPEAEGLQVFLGPTEALLMELCWEKKALTVKQALFSLKQEKELAYTSVMTVLNRLAEKGLLTRVKRGRNFEYHPAVTRKEFISQRLKLARKALDQFK